MKMRESRGAAKYPVREDCRMHLDGRSVSGTDTDRMYDATLEALVLAADTVASGRRHFGMKLAVRQENSGTNYGLGLIQEICARLHQEA